jgi:hypothetical protein
MLAFANNLQFIVNAGSKLIFNYLILTRFSGQTIENLFQVMPLGVLMTNVTYISAFIFTKDSS